jgi:hypothetical protein
MASASSAATSSTERSSPEATVVDLARRARVVEGEQEGARYVLHVDEVAALLAVLEDHGAWPLRMRDAKIASTPV